MIAKIAIRPIEHGRAAEWLCALCLASFAVTLVLPGDSFDSASFRVFRQMGLDEAAVSTPMALLAAGRLAALYINGTWQRSPIMRMVGAAFGSAIFMAISVALAWPYLMQIGMDWTTVTGLSTGAGIYLLLALFDALAAYRSGADARLAKSIFC